MNAPCPGSGANAIIGGRHLPCADCGRVVYVPTTGIVPQHEPKQSAPTPDEVRAAVNRTIHLGLGITEPCETGCSHVVVGEWTALGVANTVHRRESEIVEMSR